MQLMKLMQASERNFFFENRCFRGFVRGFLVDERRNEHSDCIFFRLSCQGKNPARQVVWLILFSLVIVMWIDDEIFSVF